MLGDSDADSSMRLEAIHALSDRALAEHHEVFVAALSDGDEYVRRAAALALTDLE